DEFVTVRRASGPDLRWSSPAQRHLTLAFMGPAPGRVVEDVLDAVRAVAARTPPARLAVADGGCFPHITRAKVLWAGVAGRDGGDGGGGGGGGDGGDGGCAGAAPLGRLARGVRSACSVPGAAPEGGPFLPHLTL